MPDRDKNPGRSVTTGRPFLLSCRERRVLAMAASGLTAEVISEQLFISSHTTRQHLKVIREKLCARNTTHAVALGLARREIDVDTVLASQGRRYE